MNLALVILLLLVGVVLLVLEVFLIPGIGWAGVFGIGALAGSIAMAYTYLGQTAGHITLIAAIVLIAIAIWIFMKNKTLEKMSLKTDIDSKVDLLSDLDLHVGDEGKTLSRLAPMGKIVVNGAEVEAKSEKDFIDPNTDVIITAINGNTVGVKVKP